MYNYHLVLFCVDTMVEETFFFFGPKTLVVDLKAAGRKLIPKS